MVALIAGDIGHAFHVALLPRREQGVGAMLNPAGDVGVGRAAVGRIVLEAAVARADCARGDDDAVGKMIFAGRDCRRGWRGK